MQDVQITIRQLDQLLPMVVAFEEQFAAQREEVVVLDWGTSYKRQQGYIVLEWEEEVDAAFIDQLTADNNVADFSVYTIPPITDDQLHILESAELEMQSDMNNTSINAYRAYLARLGPDMEQISVRGGGHFHRNRRCKYI